MTVVVKPSRKAPMTITDPTTVLGQQPIDGLGPSIAKLGDQSLVQP